MSPTVIHKLKRLKITCVCKIKSYRISWVHRFKTSINWLQKCKLYHRNNAKGDVSALGFKQLLFMVYIVFVGSVVTPSYLLCYLVAHHCCNSGPPLRPCWIRYLCYLVFFIMAPSCTHSSLCYEPLLNNQ